MASGSLRAISAPSGVCVLCVLIGHHMRRIPVKRVVELHGVLLLHEWRGNRGRRFLSSETSSPNSHAAGGCLPRSVVRTGGSTEGRRQSEERVVPRSSGGNRSPARS